MRPHFSPESILAWSPEPRLSRPSPVHSLSVIMGRAIQGRTCLLSLASGTGRVPGSVEGGLMTPAPAGIPPEDLQRGPANFCSPALPVILFSPFHSMVFGKRINRNERETILGGGSLGSCVDEERSQLRELM